MAESIWSVLIRVCDRPDLGRMREDHIVRDLREPVVHWVPAATCLQDPFHLLAVASQGFVHAGWRTRYMLAHENLSSRIHHGDVGSDPVDVHSDV